MFYWSHKQVNKLLKLYERHIFIYNLKTLEHEEVMKRVNEYKGIWINSNMKTHESFKDSSCQVDRVVIDIVSPDGSNHRKLGMLGVLTNSKSLYKSNAFGGATIEDPWECMKEYNEKLKKEDLCDFTLVQLHSKMRYKCKKWMSFFIFCLK